MLVQLPTFHRGPASLNASQANIIPATKCKRADESQARTKRMKQKDALYPTDMDFGGVKNLSEKNQVPSVWKKAKFRL